MSILVSSFYKNIAAIVFDFDGTLVDSQSMKLAAYYELFPAEQYYQQIITSVIKEIPEESRFVILGRILSKIKHESRLGGKVDQLAEEYGRIVLTRAKSCSEIPGAARLLKAACGKFALFVNSNTPAEALREIIEHRGWRQYFRRIYGYPCAKEAALKDILRSEGCLPEQVLVVGDGESDKKAAEEANCLYYAVSGDDDLITLAKGLGLL